MRPEGLDRTDPEAAIAATVTQVSNWGRWGEDDVRGTMNFVDAAKRVEAAGLVRTGDCFSLAQSFDMDGPQRGWRRRTNPVHTMLDTACAVDGRYDFFLAAAPLPITGAVGSPMNPVAVR